MNDNGEQQTGSQLILLFSGKRKSGKDFLTEILHKKLGDELSEIIRISEPIKEFWSREKGLNLKELLSDGPYKEKYRKEMILWSDEVRNRDYGFFCRAAITKATKRVVIISDIRRKNDIKFFRETFDAASLRTVKIFADEEVRLSRGWKFESGVDDVQSECDLDDVSEWDFLIKNNAAEERKQLEEVESFVRKTLNI